MPNLEEFPHWLRPEKDRATEIWVGCALLVVTFALFVVVYRLMGVL